MNFTLENVSTWSLGKTWHSRLESAKLSQAFLSQCLSSMCAHHCRISRMPRCYCRSCPPSWPTRRASRRPTWWLFLRRGCRWPSPVATSPVPMWRSNPSAHCVHRRWQPRSVSWSSRAREFPPTGCTSALRMCRPVAGGGTATLSDEAGQSRVITLLFGHVCLSSEVSAKCSRSAPAASGRADQLSAYSPWCILQCLHRWTSMLVMISRGTFEMSEEKES